MELITKPERLSPRSKLRFLRGCAYRDNLCVLLIMSAFLFCGLSQVTANTRENLKVSQNTRKVTGTITDTSGEPIIGASVSVKGTARGAISDIDGKFSVEASSNDILVISYISFHTQEIKVGNQTSFTIVLLENVTVLDDVIAIGYGTTSARRTVSALGILKTDKIDELPYTSTASSLQGRIAGVIVQQAGGEPGGTAPTISIRGGGTPLYVIDGVIRGSDDFNSLTSSDIESMSILKDASATAVYGAQAGNGIVLVTTKKGASGINIEYTGGVDFSKPTTLADRVDALDYVSAANAAARYDGQGEYALYSQSEVDAIRNGTSQIYTVIMIGTKKRQEAQRLSIGIP